MDAQFFQYIYWKVYPFPIWINLTPLLIIHWPFLHGSLSVLHSVLLICRSNCIQIGNCLDSYSSVVSLEINWYKPSIFVLLLFTCFPYKFINFCWNSFWNCTKSKVNLGRSDILTISTIPINKYGISLYLVWSSLIPSAMSYNFQYKNLVHFVKFIPLIYGVWCYCRWYFWKFQFLNFHCYYREIEV